MKSRIFNTFVALLTIAGSATAQTLSVVPFNADTDASSNIVVSIEGATAMTALQFNVKLPSNCTLAQSGSDNYGITLGSAAASHTMSVQPIDGGDIMVVLYDLYQHSFADGELLTIPVVAGSEAGTASGSLYTVRSSTVDYVSHSLGTASFTATVEETTQTAIDEVKEEMRNEKGEIYDLQGRKLNAENVKVKGFYIVNGKKYWLSE